MRKSASCSWRNPLGPKHPTSSAWRGAGGHGAITSCRDFLAAHPTTLGSEKGYAGIGTALLYSVAEVAGKIGAPLVWGEATALSAAFYRRVLGSADILDHFFIPDATLAKMRAQLTLRARTSRRPTP